MMVKKHLRLITGRLVHWSWGEFGYIRKTLTISGLYPGKRGDKPENTRVINKLCGSLEDDTETNR
jgi:hypothetical protein